MKRIAYECPITHIADTFYRLLNHYVVSENFPARQLAYHKFLVWRPVNNKS